MKKTRTDVPVELLRSMFEYDPVTGRLTRTTGKKGYAAGPVANSVWADGYLHVMVCKRTYFQHRVAWALAHGAWPAHQIDHINGDRTDNRLANLREATCSQNIINKPFRGTNKSGHKGVYPAPWNPNRWCAAIGCGGVKQYLGSYPSVEEAAAAYQLAAKEVHGEFRSQG